MKKGLISGILVLALAFPVMVAGCAPEEEVVEVVVPAGPTGELRIAMTSLYEEVLHPYRGTVNLLWYLENMYDYLIASDDEGKLDPDESIAYKWEVSADNLTWTLYIRDGVRFHNGDPVTNEDIKFSIEEVYAENSIVYGMAEFKTKIASVETAPPDKVVVHLNEPWTLFPVSLSDRGRTQGMVLPKKYYEEVGEAGFLANPVATGPYKFKEQLVGSHVTFEAVDYPHWRVGVPKYKTITYLLIPEEGTRVGMLRRGEADIIKVGIARAAELEADGFPIHSRVGAIELDVWPINSRPDENPENPASKVEVREALTYAIDAQMILDTIMGGFGHTRGAYWPMAEWALWYPGRDEAEQRWPAKGYDPEKARQLLTDADYPDGFDVWLYSFGTILAENKMVNEAVASYWEENLGLTVHILEMDYAGFRPVWRNDEEPPGLPAFFIYPYPNRAAPDANLWLPYPRAAFGQGGDPGGDLLIESLNAQTSQEGVIEAELAFFDYSYERQWLFPLFEVDDLYASAKDITDWNLSNESFGLNMEYLYQQK